MIEKRGPGRPPKASLQYNRPVRDHAPPPLPDEQVRKPNFDLLSSETKEALRQKAAAKVREREEARAMLAFQDAEEERLERELHPEAYEEELDITIDVALFADRIVLDGRHFMYGRTYKVKKRQFDALQEIMYRTRKHYDEVHRDPNKVLLEAQQAIAKGGPSYRTLSAMGLSF